MEKENPAVAAVSERLGKCKIIPVLVVNTVEEGIRICDILYRCGLPSAEITFRTSAGEGTIREALKRFPDMVAGAGTILNTEDLKRAHDAGAKFAVAPGCNPKVMKAAVELGIPFFPGVCTPSDIECAYENGASIMKFFPAEASGGISMLKALLGPFKHLGIKFIPLGGLDASNVKKYLDMKEVLAVGGSWMVKQEDVSAGKWDLVEKNINEASALLIK
jgi:2-dehydro-3-deoxyphosphogluconate aldolase/(4S)-4-hydroxy-2-oxoglutarate aldolase